MSKGKLIKPYLKMKWFILDKTNKKKFQSYENPKPKLKPAGIFSIYSVIIISF